MAVNSSLASLSETINWELLVRHVEISPMIDSLVFMIIDPMVRMEVYSAVLVEVGMKIEAAVESVIKSEIGSLL